MSTFLNFAVSGLPFGCAFALIAVGLVLTFRATGVFHFAFGVQAYAAAVLYVELIGHGVAPLLSAVITVCGAGVVVGWFLDAVLFSRIASANQQARLVMSLGITVALPFLVQMILGPTATVGTAPAPFLSTVTTSLHGVYIAGADIASFVVTLVVMVGLGLVVRSRRFGLPLRAAVESPLLLELAGGHSLRIRRFAWILSTMLSALAGVFYAPQQQTQDSTTYGVVMVAAVAAAAVGGLVNIPWAVLGGFAIGILEGIVPGYLSPDTVWYQALVPSIPFFVLLILLIAHPGLRRLDVVRDPMAAVEPPPPTPAIALRRPRLDRSIRSTRWPLLLAFLALLTWGSSDIWISTFTLAAAYAIIFLSITLITGIAGQISLAQMTFAGIGACTMAQLANNQHWPLLFAIAAAVVVAGLGGVLAALPALRLRGLPVIILTLCLAFLADNLLFPTSWIGGGVTGLVTNRPQFLGLHFDGAFSKNFFLLTVVVLFVVAGAVHLLITGTTGRALAATAASPLAAASVGVPIRKMTIAIFALSAAVAGLGGCFYALAIGDTNSAAFNSEFGPVYLVIVVTLGVGTVDGALEGGLLWASLPVVMSYLPSRVGSSTQATALTALVLSLGAFTYARHPEGIGEFAKRSLLRGLASAPVPWRRVARDYEVPS